MVKEVYDVLILGAGPAGLTAAIYAGRYNMKTLVVARSFGGTANLAGEIENWPGFDGSGVELMKNIKNQAERFGAEFLEGDVEKVERLASRKGSPSVEKFSSAGKVQHSAGGLAEFKLTVGGKVVYGRSLIVALGTEHRQLNIPGEKEFLGKGVSYCATCDGNFFKGKVVAVIGGADSAAKAALYLSEICKKVYVVYRKHEMRCEPISLKRINGKKNIEVVYNSIPTEIIGGTVVEGVRILIEDSGGSTTKLLGGSDSKNQGGSVSSEETLKVDGVFIEAGATPAVEVLKSLKLKVEKGYVVTGKNGRTSVDGVFAAGDVTNNYLKQVVTAAGEGAVAAKGAHEFLLGKN